MANGKTRVTIVVENKSRDTALMAEPGVAYWIETADERLLFDTGNGKALLPNIKVLGIDLSSADAIALSHGHGDHTNALSDAMGIAKNAKLYTHPAALKAKYSFRKGKMRYIGVPRTEDNALRKRMAEFIDTTKPSEVVKGVFVTGEVPRMTDFEDIGMTQTYTDEEGKVPDTLPDDQSLYFASRQGTVVLLGCAHSGVVNTLNYIRELTDGEPIYAVIGGMHLYTASAERIRRTIEELREFNITQISPIHCTGDDAIKQISEAYKNTYKFYCTGSVMEFDVV